jgi:membrane protease YdiL (CAAX protease family)
VKLLLLPTIVVLALIIFVSGFNFSDRPFRWRFLLVPLWALFQQYALQGYLNRRAQIVLGKGWKSVLLLGLLFAVVHLPNPLLFALTFLGGVIWAAFINDNQTSSRSHSRMRSLRYRRALFALAWTNSLRVGFKYFG